MNNSLSVIIDSDRERVERAQILKCALRRFRQAIIEREFYKKMIKNLRPNRVYGKCCQFEREDFACSDGCVSCRVHYWTLTVQKWTNSCFDAASDLDFKINLDYEEKHSK